MRSIGSGLGGRVALALMFFVCAATAPSLASAQSRHADATRQGMGHVDAFSTGYNHSCGVRDDGSATCWGDNSLGQTAAPAGRFLQIAVGGWHNCGLRSDGTATCWGNNGNGQLAAPTGTFTQLAAGGWFSCGLRTNGTLACWGYTGDGSATPPAGTFVQVSAGYRHACAVRDDGTAVCWGLNNDGETAAPANSFAQVSAGGFYSCGVTTAGDTVCWGDYAQATGENMPPAGSFVQVHAGYYQACGVRSDGTAACWGNNGSGESTAPAGQFLQVSAGFQHSCGLKPDGSAVCWGDNAGGQATAASGTFGFGAISAGIFHSCGLRSDGSAGCWGQNAAGETVAPAGSYAQIQAAYQYSCGLRPDGTFDCWGAGVGGFGQITPPAGTFWQLGSGLYTSCAVDSAGHLACWGRNAFGESTPPAGSFVQASANDVNACGVRNSGALACWGYAAFGVPTVPAGAFVQVGVGFQHACALGSNGSVTCWGMDASGSLAPPTAGFREISVNNDYACGIRGDGTLACWGNNAWGEASPPSGRFMQVSTGYEHACAIRDDGVRLCWGRSAYGQAPQLALLPATLPGGQTGAAYTATLTVGASNYVAPTPAYAISAGTLPAGLTLDAAGQLSGTPTAGGSFNFTVEGEDANGFVASRAYTVTIIDDTTAPVIVPTVTGTLGNNGWYTSDVAISWSVTDPESAISAATGCNAVTLDTDALGASYTCTATSAGGTASQTVTVKRDATAPTIAAAATTAPNAAGWYNSDVVVAFTCGDALSGVVACPASQTLSTEGAVVTSSAQSISDQAGNTSAASNVVTASIDKTAPSLAPTVAPDPILLNGTGTANANASDGLSGIVSQGCAALVTSSFGSHSVSCTATDRAGNSANASASYTVTVGIVTLVSLQVPAGQMPGLIPGAPFRLEWTVTDANGAPVTGLTAFSLAVLPMACPAGVVVKPVTRYGNISQTQTTQPSPGHYQRGWTAPVASAHSCRQLRLDLGDGVPLLVPIKIY